MRNKLIIEIEVDWGSNEFYVFNNEKDFREYFGDHEITIHDNELILKKKGIKTYGKINWGKQP